MSDNGNCAHKTPSHKQSQSPSQSQRHRQRQRQRDRDPQAEVVSYLVSHRNRIKSNRYSRGTLCAASFEGPGNLFGCDCNWQTFLSIDSLRVISCAAEPQPGNQPTKQGSRQAGGGRAAEQERIANCCQIKQIVYTQKGPLMIRTQHTTMTTTTTTIPMSLLIDLVESSPLSASLIRSSPTEPVRFDIALFLYPLHMDWWGITTTNECN